jgi:hypothetical protein
MVKKHINRRAPVSQVAGLLVKQKDWQPLYEDCQPFQVVSNFLVISIMRRTQQYLSICYLYLIQD